MKTIRLGGAVPAASAGDMDSMNGSASATPDDRNKVRRVIFVMIVLLFVAE